MQTEITDQTSHRYLEFKAKIDGQDGKKLLQAFDEDEINSGQSVLTTFIT